MMKPAGEKKRNGNDTRPKTVLRLQQLRELISPQLGAAFSRSHSQSSPRAAVFLLAAAGAARRSAAVFNPPLYADTLCIIRRIMTVITDYLTNWHVNSMPTDYTKQQVAGKLTSIRNNRSIYIKTIVPKTQAELM